MTTFKELYNSTKKFDKTQKDNRTVKDVDGKLVDIIPNTYTKMITFRFRVKSQDNSNAGYNVWLQFKDIEFSDHPLSSDSIKIVDKTTKNPLYFKRISLSKCPVRVRCSCKDFRFRFSWEDRDVQALYGGRPARYIRKPGSTRPPVNPNHWCGMCKHIIQCGKAIEHYFSR